MPVLFFLVAFFAIYFVVALIRRVLHGIAYCLGWLWGYTESFAQGRVLRALLLFAAVALGAFVAGSL